MDKFDFGVALMLLKTGDVAVRRASWHESMCIFLTSEGECEYNMFQQHTGNQLFKPPYNVRIHKHIDLKAGDSDYVIGWIPTQNDLFADDWEVYQRNLK
jgi:hypothetical protein